MATAQPRAFFCRTGLRPRSLIGRIFGFVLCTFLALGASASATELIGKVMNGTTNKPSTGDEVVLLTLSNGGTSETARAQTDSAGRFRFVVAGPGPFLVRVIHQGVSYDESEKPNGGPVVVYVYDVVNTLVSVTAVMDVQRFEATSEKLEVKQLVTMRNGSKPPRTLLDDHPFEFRLPPEAQVRSGLVQIEDGQPLREKPTPGERKGEYYFRYPLRPGDTRFAVVYQLAYHGEAWIEPEIRNPQERFVVMLPKSMKFEPQAAGIFQPMPDVSPDNVLATTLLTPGQNLAFRIFGTGMLAALQASRQQPLSREPPRPSGGPTSLPKPPGALALPRHPSQNNDSFMLVGITVALTTCMIFFCWKKRAPVAVARELNSVHSRQLRRRPARQKTRFRLRSGIP